MCSKWICVTYLLTTIVGVAVPSWPQQVSEAQQLELVQPHNVNDIKQALKRLDAKDIDYLIRQRQKFAEMSRSERAAMRELHATISVSPDPQRLHGILQRYRDWLARLPATEREQILSLEPSARIAAIKAKLSQADILADVDHLSPGDERVFMAWLGEFLDQHEEAILKLLPRAAQSKLGSMRTSRPRTMLMATMLFEMQPDLSRLPASAKSSVEQLATRLSEEGRQQFEEAQARGELRELLRGWMLSIRARHGAVSIGRERLEQFFDNELTPSERGYLEGLPPQEMERELRRMFIERRLGQWNRSTRPAARRRGP